MQVITHRGLDPSIKDYFIESSLESFDDQLSRGFGLEFDLQLTKDLKLIAFHDNTLNRISKGNDDRKVIEIKSKEILEMEFDTCHIISLDKLLKLIEEKQAPKSISAIHLKSSLQKIEFLDIFLFYLEDIDVTKFIIFDVKIETAIYLKNKNSKLQLAPSVSHHFDIKRYNEYVGETLISLESALQNHHLFDWFWLDEWDTIDENNGIKFLYTKDVFNKIQNKGIKIAVVTPELHATSPGLLGGESHPDAINQKSLFARIKEIMRLKPDIICTDYPEKVKKIYEQELF